MPEFIGVVALWLASCEALTAHGLQMHRVGMGEGVGASGEDLTEPEEILSCLLEQPVLTGH